MRSQDGAPASLAISCRGFSPRYKQNRLTLTLRSEYCHVYCHVRRYCDRCRVPIAGTHRCGSDFWNGRPWASAFRSHPAHPGSLVVFACAACESQRRRDGSFCLEADRGRVCGVVCGPESRLYSDLSTSANGAQWFLICFSASGSHPWPWRSSWAPRAKREAWTQWSFSTLCRLS